MLICRVLRPAFRLSPACPESSCFPRISLFLSLPAVCSWPVVSSSLFARYLARWAPAQPMKARGGELLRRSYGMAGIAEGGWKEVEAGGEGGPLPPQRSYCFSHPVPPSFLPPASSSPAPLLLLHPRLHPAASATTLPGTTPPPGLLPLLSAPRHCA